jgi:hypothetical protein
MIYKKKEITGDETKPRCQIRLQANVDVAERMKFPDVMLVLFLCSRRAHRLVSERRKTKVESDLRVKAQTISQTLLWWGLRGENAGISIREPKE